MATMKYKPTTPSRRHMSVASFEEITKFSPEKSLIETKKKHAGRNSYGKITVRHQGGGNKQKYRLIDSREKTVRQLLSVLSTTQTEHLISHFFKMMKARRAT